MVPPARLDQPSPGNGGKSLVSLPVEPVRAQLNKILASNCFRSSERLSRFLRFVVEHTLKGEADQLKEYRLGTEVFDRPSSYDPRIDPVVRVEAGRLRAKLREYYETEGSGDDIRVELPKGGYSATFGARPQADSPLVAAGPATKEGEPGPASLAEDRPQRLVKPSRWSMALVAVILLGTATGFSFYRWKTRTSRPSPAASELRSIAVLPFLNLSSSPEDDHISDGLADEITTALSRVEGLRVVSRTSAFKFKGKGEDIRTIGQQLNVGAVVEGSLQREGKRLRVTVQFIRVSNGYHLWAELYEADAQSVFALEDTISRAVTASLQAHLDRALGQPPVVASTRDAEANSLYLKGRYAWNRRTKTGLEQSIQFFQQAIQRDPQYAQAYAALAEAYTVMAVDEMASPADFAPQAKRAAEEALRLDPRLGEAYATLAQVQFTYDWDFAGADRNYRRAIELDPNNATAHHWYGVSLMMRKRFDEAAREFGAAQQLDPLSLVIPAALGISHFYAGEPDLAIAQAESIIAAEPHFPYAHDLLGLGYLEKRLYKQAIAEFKQYASLYESDPDALMRLASAYAANGQREEAKKILRQLHRLAKDQYVSPCYMAQIYARLGENNLSLEWLDKAHQQHAPALLLISVEPDYESLRQDPRFQELAHRIGLAL